MNIHLGPHSPVREAAIGVDVEGGQSDVRLGDDQGRVIGCDSHAIGEGEAVGHLANGAVGRHQRDEPRSELPSGKSKPMLFT